MIAGDGNKACYLATPKVGGCLHIMVSLLQFWIDRMNHTATQSRFKNCGRAAPVHVKHFISCSYKDLVFLAQNLRGIKTETYTEELAKKTGNVGDCCMMSICEWGHAKLEFEEHIEDFGSQEHMDHVGEFNFSVNGTCLSCDHNIFMAEPSDTDSHNPLLVHLKPSDMGCTEKHAYVLPAKKFQRKERRKDIQMQNKRKGFGDGGPFMEVLFGHGGHKTPTLAMVAPLLRQQGNGDQRTEECIFLEGEDTTR